MWAENQLKNIKSISQQNVHSANSPSSKPDNISRNIGWSRRNIGWSSIKTSLSRRNLDWSPRNIHWSRINTS